MDEAPEEEVRSLRFLRLLVTVLTSVMIVGFVILIGYLVTQFPETGGAVAVPEEIDLPEGAKALAYTQGTDWVAVVTDQDEILIFNTDGSLRQRVQVQSP